MPLLSDCPFLRANLEHVADPVRLCGAGQRRPPTLGLHRLPAQPGVAGAEAAAEGHLKVSGVLPRARDGERS